MIASYNDYVNESWELKKNFVRDTLVYARDASTRNSRIMESMSWDNVRVRETKVVNR